MPKYKNGSEPKLGDVVRGVTHNSNGKMISGTIFSLTPGAEAANCQVAYLEVMPTKQLNSWETGHVVKTTKGEEFVLIPRADFADTKGLERISEALAAKVEPLKARAAGR